MCRKPREALTIFQRHRELLLADKHMAEQNTIHGCIDRSLVCREQASDLSWITFHALIKTQWKELSGIQRTDLMWFWHVRVWQACWRGAWGDLIKPDLCPRVTQGPTPQSHVLDAAVTSPHTHIQASHRRHARNKLINSSHIRRPAGLRQPQSTSWQTWLWPNTEGLHNNTTKSSKFL